MKMNKLSAAILGALAGAVAVNSAFAATVKVKSVEFTAMPSPATSDEKADAYSKAKIKYTYTDGKSQEYDMVYHKLMGTTDVINGKVVGGLFNAKNEPLMDNDGHMASDSPDGTSLMKINGMKSSDSKTYNPLALVNHFEYKELPPNDGVSTGSFWSRLPASVGVSKLDQNRKTGELTVKDYNYVDYSGVFGHWIHCGATLSAWNTFISAEEYEPDAKTREGLRKSADSDDATDLNSFSKYHFGDEKKANPYHYGYVPEVSIDKDGKTSKVVKHYSSGRIAREMQEMATDNRTAISGDDGKSTGLFMYVADTAKKLSAGTVYAGKITQKGDASKPEFGIQWIRLGHATDNEVKAFIDKGIKFSDMFEAKMEDPNDTTYKKVITYVGTEWLKLKSTNDLGMKKEEIAQAAAFLETRRYAALMGATTEFSKMEYIAFNKEDKKFYITISRVEATMADTAGDIQLPRNDGGFVLEMTTAAKQKDISGKIINSDFVGTKLTPITELVGKWSKDKDAEGNECDQEHICGPDNIRYVSTIRTLFVGEDTSRRNNNYVWAFNIDTKKLSRIFSAPMGAEATGLGAFPNYDGFAYITSNFQHAAEEELPKYLGADKAQVLQAINSKWNKRKQGAIGYIGIENGALPKFE